MVHDDSCECRLAVCSEVSGRLSMCYDDAAEVAIDDVIPSSSALAYAVALNGTDVLEYMVPWVAADCLPIFDSA